MPTPEEEAAAAAEASRKKAEGDRFADLESKLETERKGRQELELRLAKDKVFATFTNIVDFKDMISGSTPDEIFNAAKALSEKVAARDAAAVKAKEDELKAKWGQIPGGSPIAPALTQSRMDEYENAKKIPVFSDRIATLFKMKVEDMHGRMRAAAQAFVKG